MERIKLTKSPNPSEQAKRLPFGPPPLIDGESSADYKDFLARVSAAVKPTDILEEIWIRDVVDHEWEVLRLRRYLTSLLTASAREHLLKELDTFMETNDAEQLADSWSVRDREAIKQVTRLVATGDVSMDAVMALTLSDRIDDVERIDRMIMTREARRDAALREIDRHREVLAQRLRQSIQQVEDAEFKEIKPPAIAHRKPS